MKFCFQIRRLLIELFSLFLFYLWNVSKLHNYIVISLTTLWCLVGLVSFKFLVGFVQLYLIQFVLGSYFGSNEIYMTFTHQDNLFCDYIGPSFTESDIFLFLYFIPFFFTWYSCILNIFTWRRHVLVLSILRLVL